MAHGSTISKGQGRKLWDHLVGRNATCFDDMTAGWDDINNAFKRTHLHNEFLNACLHDYLPELPPRCFCAGALGFVRENLLADLDDPSTTIFDVESITDCKSLELLWRMVLESPPHTIEDQAIHTLVSEVYVNSATIKALPPDRAREIHFLLAKRCMRQLNSAAQALQSLERNTAAAAAAAQSTDSARVEQSRHYELQFTRSLRVVKDLLRTLKGQAHFSAPDLRSLMLQSPSAVDGDLADLKYQSFDEDGQSAIVPFNIGLRNTGASLLASLRAATGFHNYRLYYRGQPLAPTSDDVCKSIQELDITSGLILIYQFLIKLPADESILATFEDPSTSHQDIFPLGQPFKSLYAVYALREHLNAHRMRNKVVQSSSHDLDFLDESATNHRKASVRVLSVLVSALCDEAVIQQDLSENLQTLLRSQLLSTYVQVVEDSVDELLETALISPHLCSMLMRILDDATHAPRSQTNTELIKRVVQAVLVSSARSSDFWNAFKAHPGTPVVLERLILADSSKQVRKGVVNLIANRSLARGSSEAVSGTAFAGFFWSIIFDILPKAALLPSKSDEVFYLAIQLFTKLAEADSQLLDVSACSERCGSLLMERVTTEDITQVDTCDSISHGLAVLLCRSVSYARERGFDLQLGRDFSRRLLQRHLFPSSPTDSNRLVPRVIVNPATRSALYDVVFILSRESSPTRLLRDIDGLTPYEEGAASPYFFELPQAFDRQRAVRSSCGYAGLRNLSNTCYYNSLMTQLFMNTEFREFILSTRVPDPTNQQLIYETRKLFAALQGSLRRFVDPQSCIAQISTYEEAPVDVHNQMDVDEFYNLLFDRWESQLSSEVEKRRLKSIFGGELVQQVKSKECDHISERFEDFGAIQCDIKGKATLEESLQAYVDGEIMQGDNKYKCSSCDRFVDAVKRACFKTLPNSLIFHLKRFEFSLRNMTRAKINDHFRFPASIDMKPYTVQHLANLPEVPSSDMFELVGVLVHSGSAESGHYYSYIRERSGVGATGKWVEFNDDVVTSWDPSLMSDACFGGQDQRQPFDGGPHDKPYSAYMLFYQRSSSPAMREAGAEGSGYCPLDVALPADLAPEISGENNQIVHRHCLHDPNHTPFVIRTLSSVWEDNCSSANHAVENLAMQVGLNHLDQIASRAKDLPDFPELLTLLQQACQRCAHCCLAFFDYMFRRPEALIMLLQKNPNGPVRHEIGRTLIAVLRNLRKNFPEGYGAEPLEIEEVDDPENTITRTVELFSRLWEQFHVSLRSWPEYFGTMLDFARLGRQETAALIQGNFLFQIAAVIAIEAVCDIDTQYTRLATILSRRMARPPSYENIISLLDIMMGVMDKELTTERIVESDEDRFLMVYEDDTIPFSSHEVNLLHQSWAGGRGNIFVDKLIQINQNVPATDSIIQKLLSLSVMMDTAVYTTLRLGITGNLVQHLVTPYLRAASVYCRSSQNKSNAARLRAHINHQCVDVQNAEARSFYEFQKHMYTSADDFDEQLKNLVDFQKWAPGLLGHVDQTVSRDVYRFINETLLRFGPNPNFSEAHGGEQRAKAVTTAAKRLCLSCLIYLRDTYVERGIPVAKETVLLLLHTIRGCGGYFSTDGESEGLLDAEYLELCQTVLEPMNTLAVDDIDEDSEWENSIDSSDHMNSLDDLSMQVASDAQGGS
ncbi:hypothetical protein Micbo1qcDRAFT_230193 [Microdochium bolleyi]|uniref:USP domain-containing protein n=1 Tax=Microdochium bolleyi TaxID=196109 RepID=A0A136JKA3_9PEZI|nr:hypothetical protein Micbo1qcDRAFT_230193 [Microdochium bolleyi]